MRSLSPLTMSVGFVMTERSDAAERPQRWMAENWVPKAVVRMGWSRSSPAPWRRR